MLANKEELDHSYYSFFRTPLIQMIQSQPKSILELGCGSGRTLVYCKQTFNSDCVVGIELNEKAAEAAISHPDIDKIFIGNIETSSFHFETESFDLLIASHVLEHTVDPWKTLSKISQWVRKGGQILIALPNARHINLTLPLLLNGKFQYVESGILDRTHLRFFTRDSMVSLVEQVGLQLDMIEPDYGARSVRWNQWTLGLCSDHLAYAYNLSCTRL